MFDEDLTFDFLEIDTDLLDQTSNESRVDVSEEQHINALVNEKTSEAFNQLNKQNEEKPNLFEAHGEITTHWFLSDAPDEGYEFVLNR